MGTANILCNRAGARCVQTRFFLGADREAAVLTRRFRGAHMRIAILGDLHLIAPDDPDHERRVRRRHFADTGPAWAALTRSLRDQRPDLLLCAGDLVDWCSPANVAYARAQMDALGIPWLMTPGNHDLEGPGTDHAAVWQAQGLMLGNRLIDCDGLGIVLLDSHDSGLPADTGFWLDAQATPGDRPLILVTHVPWNSVAMQAWIEQRQPGRDLKKYVQSRVPLIYDQHLRGRFHSAFFGHLHCDGLSHEDGTCCHMLSLALHAAYKDYPGQGRYAMLDSTTLTARIVSHPRPDDQ